MDTGSSIVVIVGSIILFFGGIGFLGVHLDQPRQAECHELEKIATLYGNLTDKQKEIVFDKCNHEKILKIKPYS